VVSKIGIGYINSLPARDGWVARFTVLIVRDRFPVLGSLPQSGIRSPSCAANGRGIGDPITKKFLP
jgi:hypothetical protein